MAIVDVLRKILVANELGGNLSLAYQFSDPDGARTGKSGYSYGLCQFDLANNPAAGAGLGECGFTDTEISSLKLQTPTAREMVRLNTKLAAAADLVDTLDGRALKAIVAHTREVLAFAEITAADPETFLALCDYHNQFYIEHGGKCVRALRQLDRPVTARDVYDYKLTTLWGTLRPDDVRRRYANIVRIVQEAGQ